MDKPTNRGRALSIAIAVFGIAIELIAIFLLASDRVGGQIATPLIIFGMLLAFAPMFLASRRR